MKISGYWALFVFTVRRWLTWLLDFAWHLTNTYSCQEDQDPLTSRFLIPLHLLFTCVPFLVLPFLLVCVTHQPRNSLGSFSPLSVSLLLYVWFFQSLVTRLLFSKCTFALLWPLPLHVSIPSGYFCFSLLMFFPSNHVLLWWFFSFILFPSLSHCYSFLPHFHTSSTCIFSLYMSALIGHLLLQLLTSLPSFIEWPLSYDHFSLLPLLFPLPSLSISLGGPAFLPGFCRPRCENWRWRGRWRRWSSNQRSRPQSLFLGHFLCQLAPQWSPPSNHRSSLSTRSSSTS